MNYYATGNMPAMSSSEKLAQGQGYPSMPYPGPPLLSPGLGPSSVPMYPGAPSQATAYGVNPSPAYPPTAQNGLYHQSAGVRPNHAAYMSQQAYQQANGVPAGYRGMSPYSQLPTAASVEAARYHAASVQNQTSYASYLTAPVTRSAMSNGNTSMLYAGHGLPVSSASSPYGGMPSSAMANPSYLYARPSSYPVGSPYSGSVPVNQSPYAPSAPTYAPGQYMNIPNLPK